MMRDTMSLLGLYQYDNTLFANLQIPEAMSSDDKNTLVNNLLIECAELETLYTDPDFMKWVIGIWSVKELPTWTRIYNASVAEYDPIENYNRYEESTETVDGTRKHSGNDSRRVIIDDASSSTNSGTTSGTTSGSEAHSGTDQTSGTKSETDTNSGSDVTTNQIAAFDTNSLVDHDKSTLAHGHVLTVSGQEAGSVLHGHQITTSGTSSGTVSNTESNTYDGDTTDTFTHGEQIKDDSERETESHIHGNIGVTTSQQMLESELMIAPKLNIINYIIESFKNRFCLQVY